MITTPRDKLIISFLRAIAMLLGKGEEFDAQVERLKKLTPREIEEETRRMIASLHQESK